MQASLVEVERGSTLSTGRQAKARGGARPSLRAQHRPRRAGDRCWIVDVAAPFGGGDNILKALKERALRNEDVQVLRNASPSRERKVRDVGLRVGAIVSTSE